MEDIGESPFSKQHMKWLDKHFKRVWPFLEKAIDRMSEPYDVDYVWSRIKDGTAQLFPGVDSAIVCEINDAVDGSRFMSVWLAGGDLREVFQLASSAEITAKKANCKSIIFVGRPGFMRKAPEGYRHTATVMRKAL